MNEEYGNKKTNKHYHLNNLIIKKLNKVEESNAQNQIIQGDHVRFMGTLNKAIDTDNFGLI